MCQCAALLLWCKVGTQATGQCAVSAAVLSAECSKRQSAAVCYWPVCCSCDQCAASPVGCLQIRPVCSRQCAKCVQNAVWKCGESGQCAGRRNAGPSLPPSLLSAHCTLLKDTTQCCFGMWSELCSEEVSTVHHTAASAQHWPLARSLNRGRRPDAGQCSSGAGLRFCKRTNKVKEALSANADK